MECGKEAVLLQNIKTREFMLSRVFCGSWKCPGCRKKKIFEIRKKIEDVSGIYNMCFMVTLTTKGEADNVQKWFRKIQKCFSRKMRYTKKYLIVKDLEIHLSKISKMNAIINVAKTKGFYYKSSNYVQKREFRENYKKEIKKEFYRYYEINKSNEDLVSNLRYKINKMYDLNKHQPLRYVRVREYTKEGKEHFHIMTNRYFPMTYIERSATTDSYIYDVSSYEDVFKKEKNRSMHRAVANYVSKYISKNIDETLPYLSYEVTYGSGLTTTRLKRLVQFSSGLEYGVVTEKRFELKKRIKEQIKRNNIVFKARHLGDALERIHRYYIDEYFMNSSSINLVQSSRNLIEIKLSKRKKEYEDRTKYYNRIIYERLKRLSVSKENRTYIFEKMSLEQNSYLCDEQIKVVNEIFDNKCILVNGRAGTGKTKVIEYLRKYLRDYKVLYTAFTGKTVSVLNSKLGGDIAMTLHRALDSNFNGEFYCNERNLLDYDIVVIDEISMVDKSLFANLLLALRDDVKLVMLGDEHQINPINSNSLIDELKELIQYVTFTTLVKNHRSADRVIEMSERVLRGETIGSVDGDYIYYANKYIEGDEDVDEFQILCNSNCQVEKINRYISRARGGFEVFDGYKYSVGDRVIVNENNYRKGIRNGQVGIIVDDLVDDSFHFGYGISHLDLKSFKIRFLDSNKELEFSKKEMYLLRPAFAITIHKSQGSEFQKGVVLFDDRKILSNKNMLYTAVTRFKENVEIYYSNDKIKNLCSSAVRDCVQDEMIVNTCEVL